MAELLIKAVSNAHNDLMKSARACYKKGDIIVAACDNHVWGRSEGLPKFYVVKVPDISVAEVNIYCDPHYKGLSDTELKHKRKYKFDVTKLSLKNQNDIETKGIVTVSKAVLKKCMVTKV